MEQNLTWARITNCNFLLQILLSETTILNISSHLKFILSVPLTQFFSCFT